MQTQRNFEVSTARLDRKRVIERSEWAIGRTVGAYRLKRLRCGDRRGEDPAAWKGYPGLVRGRGEDRPKGAQWPRWWPKGERAPGLADKRFVSTCLYACGRPPTMPSRSSSPRSMPTPWTYSSIASSRASCRTPTPSCCWIKPDGTARRRSRCRWEEPSTASKAGVFLFLGRPL